MTTLPSHLLPPARTDVHTVAECDQSLNALSEAMRDQHVASGPEGPAWDALVDSADAWLDERNRCVSALATHAALAA